MRWLIVMIVVIAQAMVLIYMTGEREFIVRYGQTIYLRTAPIDARDVFRGDFVRLNYALSRVGPGQMRGTLASDPPARGAKVYASLKLGFDDLAEFESLSDVEPDGGLFLGGQGEVMGEH